MSQWIIVYPRGDTSKLAVVEISPGLEYEINDYRVASRQRFHDTDIDETGEAEAAEYARELAKKHGLDFDYDGFLD